MVCQIDIILHYITTLLSTNQCSSQVWSNGQADGPSLVLFHANYLPVSNRIKRVFWSEMKGVAKIKRYCHLGMAKIILFYSGVMALILPWFKEITNFVLKLMCSLFIFKCLRGDLYSSKIHHWNRQLKPYWYPLRKNRVN